jgi:hypothetical protein
MAEKGVFIHHGNEVQLYYDVEDTRTRRDRTLLREVPEKNNGRESQWFCVDERARHKHR